MRFPYLIMIFLALGVGGCASYGKADRDARQTALVLHRQVVALKSEVRRKIAAERRYYQQAIDTLDRSRLRTDYNELRRSMIVGAKEEAASMRKRPNDVTDASIAASLVEHAKKYVEIYESGDRQRLEQRDAYEASLKELNALGREYGVLEKTLLQLTVPPDRRGQVGQLAQIIADLASYYQELAKREEPGGTGSP